MMTDMQTGGTDATANGLRQGLNLQIGALIKLLGSVLPGVQSISGTATAGGSTALPATPYAYINMTLPSGQAVKIPCYLP